MNVLEFKDFFPPRAEDKHFGIATIMWNGLLLAFKLQPSKDGKGYFPVTSSFTVYDQILGKDKFVPGFKIDSSYEKERIEGFVMANVQKFVKRDSVFQETPTSPPIGNLPNW